MSTLPGCPLSAERGEVEQCATACAPPDCARIIRLGSAETLAQDVERLAEEWECSGILTVQPSSMSREAAARLRALLAEHRSGSAS